MGMFLYSAALEMISIKPRIFVLAFRDMLNNSAKRNKKPTQLCLNSSYWKNLWHDKSADDNWFSVRIDMLAQTDGGVVDVVVGGDHAQIERRDIHLILYADALGLLQVM